MIWRQATCFFLREGHTHNIKPVTDDNSIVYYWAHFRNNQSESATTITVEQLSKCKNQNKLIIYLHQLNSELLSNFSPPYSLNHTALSDPSQFQSLATENQAPAILGNALTLDYLMSLILLQLACDQQKQNTVHLFSRIKEYILLNYRSNLTLNKLAEVFPYSPDYISRIFKTHAGMPIKQYIHTLRLTEAKQRLLTTIDTIQQIANACGYSNEKFFITTFSKYEGLTPGQYRNLFSQLHVNDK